MKKCWIIAAALALLLTGCSSEPVFEQVQDVFGDQEFAPVGQISLSLPDNAAVTAISGGESDRLFLCDGYTVTTHTLEAGDLDRTLREMTGYGREDLTVMETTRQDVKCYECAWVCAGEGGDHVGRLVILDDGNYHYVATVMAEASLAGQFTQIWQQILGSFTVADTAP